MEKSSSTGYQNLVRKVGHMEEKLMNIGEVAGYLKISEGEVKELVEKGILPAYKIGGVLLRFKRDQIVKYVGGSGISTAVGESHAGERQEPTYAQGNVFRPAMRREYSTDYSFLERLEDCLYYNDFYILSAILLALIVAAIF